MLDGGVIDKSNSNWQSPVVLVKKSGSDEYRFAVDYRKLNKISKPLHYPLLRLTDIPDAQYFTFLYSGKAFWQVLSDKENRDKAALFVMMVYFLLKNEFSSSRRLQLFVRPNFTRR